MVSTRNHPRQFPETPGGSVAPRTPASSASSAARATSPNSAVSRRSGASAAAGWAHTPAPLALGWIAVSVPFVVYDAAYILARPHSMRDGWLYGVFRGYEWYANVDYVYGWPSFSARDGWPGAQTWMNVVETLGYLLYLYIVVTEARQKPRGGRRSGARKAVAGGLAEQFTWMTEPGSVHGRVGAVALLLGFSTALMTLNKTALYWLNEYCSGFAHVKHNRALDLAGYFLLSAPWVIFPAWMCYTYGQEIVQSLASASTPRRAPRKSIVAEVVGES